MTIQVTGKNVEAGDAFTSYVTDRISTVLGKYLGPDITGHVRLAKERFSFHTSCSLRLRSGLLLEANGEGSDAYASADAAVDHLETRIRRHKKRLRSHHHEPRTAPSGKAAAESTARDVILSLDNFEDEDEAGAATGPVIIAEAERGIKEMPVSEAVMQLDVTEKPFLVFRNASHGELNVVYRRADGNIGWIDPRVLPN